MSEPVTANESLEELAGKKIAAHFLAQGLDAQAEYEHRVIDHLGALIAATILQSNSGFRKVVVPRIRHIEKEYPQYTTVNALLTLMRDGETPAFLKMKEGIKSYRFETFVRFLAQRGINTMEQLREALQDESFCDEMERLEGFGKKSVDFMKIYSGLESIAIDRHLREFAISAGINKKNYDFLQKAYLKAAHILKMSPRDLDRQIWEYQSGSSTKLD